MLLERAETDWIASRNIFYNTRSNLISDNINDLINPEHLDFHSEGLINYLDYGYSVYGQTPLADIKLLEHDKLIYKDDDGTLRIEKKEDPMEKLLGGKTTPAEVIDYLSTTVNEWTKEREGAIIVPTSGGFDSRLLDHLIKDKNRIHAYTYGTSINQEESYETVYASKLCEILGIDWTQIQLSDFHNLIEEWYALFGISTHAHGMYQMEFYEKILKKEEKGSSLLSGIYGDLWAGSKDFAVITNINELSELGITHGMNADSSQTLFSGDYCLKNQYWIDNKEKLKDKNWRIIEAGRTKIVLISYLMRVPEKYGLKSWSPFLNEKVVAMMLNMDWADRARRQWQIDYFNNNHILIGEMNLTCDKVIRLNEFGYKKVPVRPLNSSLFDGLIRKEYIDTINNKLCKPQERDWETYYNAYLTIYPIERILEIAQQNGTSVRVL
ncbi:hypothetical protein SAMN05216349_13414 [Oribacterium sp. KHPX15]|uniref:hypothetical protein n=1 Tax=Oribacterium sp. KHPX15 TaxID=1855342 RepID=UPI00089A2363|nr:hypothetical protein [Oribacterium sp. KHPX15]SEA83472.1 hypothetical protein SAMN05216349_13414 [Oribacterium sp. KHPX15]